MSTVAAVNLWGTRIGAVSIEDDGDVPVFQYTPEFVRSGIEVSPLRMPLAERPYRFPALSRESFGGLPGLLADSLPDAYGNALIDAWLATQGREPESFNIVERLCYIGTRGMGALEFAPSRGPRPARSHDIQIAALVELASEVLTDREGLVASLAERGRAEALKDLLSVGTSAGGARAKAVIAYNPRTDQVRSGQIDAGPGFEHWLLKFDGVTGAKDRELDLPEGYGAVELAYAHMAGDAGIVMTESRLLEENGRRHFMTRRFDRHAGGGKLHMQSLAALGHFDFRLAAAHSYEQAFDVVKRLDLGPEATEQMFRRMAFNVIARNQDDHVKNLAFLMDRRGRWSLSPAFDVTYAYSPSGVWTRQHQMSINGKRDGFSVADFRAVAAGANMKRGSADRLVDEVSAAVARWRTFAAGAGVEGARVTEIERAHRLDLPDG